jgi:hypothetical protein
MPCETDCSDSPSALAMPPRLGLSSIPSNDENIESDISISFLPCLLPLTAHLLIAMMMAVQAGPTLRGGACGGPLISRN